MGVLRRSREFLFIRQIVGVDTYQQNVTSRF